MGSLGCLLSLSTVYYMIVQVAAWIGTPLLYSCLCAYVCMCFYTYGCICTCVRCSWMYTHMYVETRGQFLVLLLKNYLPYVFERVPPVWDTTNGMADSEPQGSTQCHLALHAFPQVIFDWRIKMLTAVAGWTRHWWG